MAEVLKGLAGGYGWECRSLWMARPGWMLVGCDAEGLEARMLGHYLHPWDKGAFAEAVVNGRKDIGTDIHTVNLKACQNLGLVSRDGAKTLLYALMYGAGDAKLGATVQGDRRSHGKPLLKMQERTLGVHVRRALATSMIGIDKLTDAAKKRSKSRGFLIGLDGRHVPIRSEHSALNTLLQSGGAIVMKKALQLYLRAAPEHGLVLDSNFALCANVHDEVQQEAIPELAETAGKLFAESITQAGIALGVRCPLAGDYKVGKNWAETH